MNKIKQVIVVRKDLNMRKGKIAVQACHGSLGVILDMLKRNPITYSNGHGVKRGLYFPEIVDEGTPLYEWLEGKFTKITLYVNSEEEIFDLEKKCKLADIACAVITDSGLTEFHGVPTVTCVAIGPYWSEKIDEITGDLPLL